MGIPHMHHDPIVDPDYDHSTFYKCQELIWMGEQLEKGSMEGCVPRLALLLPWQGLGPPMVMG